MKKVLAFVALFAVTATFTPKSECALPAEGGGTYIGTKGKLDKDGVCYGFGNECMYARFVPTF